MQRQLLTINFDLKNKTQASFVYKQGEIDHNGVLVELVNIDTKNSTGQVRIKDPEGKLLEPGIVIVSEDTANFVLPTYLVGTWEFEVRIFNDNGTTISNTYSYDVLESLGFDVTSIEQYESAWDTWTKEFVSWESSENTRVTNETTRISNENSRKTAETSRVSADNTRESRMKGLETRFNNMTASQQGSTEVVDARTDYNGVEHDSLKTRLDNDYETLASLIPTDIAFNGYESVTTNDTLSGEVKNTTLTGQTLVNLANKKDDFTYSDEGIGYWRGTMLQTTKINTTYTFVLTVKNNTRVDNDSAWGIYADGTGGFTGSVNLLSDYTGFNGTIVAKVTRGDSTSTHHQKWSIGVHRGTGSITLSNLIILEGDHTDKPLEFFEGLKSTEVSEVTSHGVNLVESKYESTSYHTNRFNIPLDPSKRYRMFWNAKNDSPSTLTSARLILGNTDNTFENTTYLSDQYWSTIRQYTFTGKTYVSWRYGSGTGTITLKEFAIVEVTPNAPTEYIPYQESKTTLSEPIILRSLPNGISDTYDVDTGVLTRRCGEVVLNGSESWSIGQWTPLANTIVVETTYLTGIGAVSNKLNARDTTGDNFVHVGRTVPYDFSTTDVEGCAKVAAGDSFAVRIAKSKLPTPDVAGFKAWLAQNPTTVVYQLATPTTEYIENNGQLRSYDYQTTVSADSVVPVKLNGNIPVNYASTLAKTLMRVDELKEENKKLLETIETLSNDVNQIHAFMYAMMNNASTLEEPEELIDDTKEPIDDTKEPLDDNSDDTKELIDNTKELIDDTKELIGDTKEFIDDNSDDNEEFLGDNSDDTKEFLDDNSDLNDDEVI